MPDRTPDRVAAEAHTAWAKVADELVWDKPWHVLCEPDGRLGRWFIGGRLNLSVNCIDRHLLERADQPVILWEGEPGDRRALTYAELHEEVCALAGALRGLGVGVGDRVALHLGWLPETVAVMLACARIGAVHTVLPTPLPPEALAERLDAFRPKVVFTQDGAWRHGTILPLKAHADEALAAVGGVECLVVVRRTGLDVAWYEGDRWLHELLASGRPGTPAPDTSPVPVDAEHHVLAVPLANRRGRPVSVLHGTANLLASAVAVHRYGLADPGVFWCAAEISWIGAQVHGVYGPLACGDPAVMFEGMLDVPTRRRAWDIVERYRVRTLITTPTVLRRLRGWSGRPPSPASVASLRRVVTMAESADEQLADWLTHEVGKGQITVADAWGQMELSGIASVDRPLDSDRLPDAGLAIVDEAMREVPDGERGELVVRQPWAGMLRDLEGPGSADTAQRRWRRPGVYSTGDMVRRRAAGRLEFLGRLDEVVSISGQLVSLNEVREVLTEHPFVEAAEVADRADPRLGQSLVAAVVLYSSARGLDDTALARELFETVREVLGGLARPRALLLADRFGDDLPTPALRRALVALAASASETPVRVTWSQIQAAAAAQPD